MSASWLTEQPAKQGRRFLLGERLKLRSLLLIAKQADYPVPVQLKQVRHGRRVWRLAKLLLSDRVVHELKDVFKLVPPCSAASRIDEDLSAVTLEAK